MQSSKKSQKPLKHENLIVKYIETSFNKNNIIKLTYHIVYSIQIHSRLFFSPNIIDKAVKNDNTQHIDRPQTVV